MQQPPQRADSTLPPDQRSTRTQPTLPDSPDDGQISANISVKQFDNPADTEFLQPLDGGWHAWLVCATAFCTNGSIFSILNSFGIICEWIIEKNGISKSLAGAISSVTIGCMFAFSFIVSIIMDRVGIRPCAIAGGAICTLSLLISSFICAANSPSWLILTHSFLFGVGSALAYTPSLVILGHHFERHLGLVNGIVAFGSAVFSVALARILKSVMLDNLGLPNTLRVLCCVTALIVLYPLAWAPKRPTKHSELDHYLSGRSSIVERVSGIRVFLARFLNVSVWRSRGFVVWTIACPIAMIGYFVPFAFLPNFMHVKTLEQQNLAGLNMTGADNETQRRFMSAKATAESNTAVMLICINVGSGVSRVAVGKLADYACFNRIRLQQAALCILGACMMLLPFCAHNVLFILLSLLFGIGDGSYVCLIGPIAFDLVGPSGASQAIGFLLLAMSVPTAAGTYFAGYISDVSGSWDIPFFVSGALPIVAAVVMFLIPQTQQAYPAASIAEDFDQMVRSYLDVGAYTDGQVNDEGGWQRASSIVSVGRPSDEPESESA